MVNADAGITLGDGANTPSSRKCARQGEDGEWVGSARAQKPLIRVARFGRIERDLFQFPGL